MDGPVLKLPLVEAFHSLRTGRRKQAIQGFHTVTREYSLDHVDPSLIEVRTEARMGMAQFLRDDHPDAFSMAEQVAQRAITRSVYGPVAEVLLDLCYNEEDPSMFLHTARGRKLMGVIETLRGAWT